ncbi:MAG: hypothetical protein HYU57_05985 [Micavibrio aeruginosavorus]|nr:hypothetical protein [Micavibrio aeruginosavorus]
MGWFGKDKNEGKEKPPASVPAAETAEQKSARIRAEAMANARAARERLGDDTIQKIAEALREQSAGKQARDKIRDMDKARVAEHLKSLLEDK